MTLLDAEVYDAARARRRTIKIIAALLMLLVIAGLAWMYRNFPEERVVNKFFDAIQQQRYETAYAIWFNDPNWQQHPAKYAQYPYADFYRDWGPGGDWGLVKTHKIYGSGAPKGGSSGVIVEVIVNGRTEHARLWVQKSDKTLSFSPY